MFRKEILGLLDFASILEHPAVHVELEIRKPCPKPSKWVISEITEIKYYKSSQYPKVTFRKINNGRVESKQEIKRISFDNMTIVLSVEKKYVDRSLPLELTETKRYYRKNFVREGIKVEVTEYINEQIFTKEIEINKNTDLDALDNVLQKDVILGWPPVKPFDAHITELWHQFSKNLCYMTHKLDGQRYTYYLGSSKHTLVAENGQCHDNYDQDIDNDLIAIFDGEMLHDVFYVFDCHFHNKIDLTLETFDFRLKIINKFFFESLPIKCMVKKYVTFNSFREFKDAFEICSKIPECDGIIVTTYKGVSYKSKPKPTVDLLCFSNSLYLQYNKRVGPASEGLENGVIYEFDVNDLNTCIRPRPDKTAPNHRMPLAGYAVEDMVLGRNCVNMRAYHNSVKADMLAGMKSDVVLMDVGSGIGGDTSKWKQFKHVYAVDPFMNISDRKVPSNVTRVYEKAQDWINGFGKDIHIDAVSVFFVPDCEDVLLRLASEKYAYICGITMSTPENIDTKYYNVKVCEDFKSDLNGTVNINITGSRTALDITEKILSIERIQEIFKNYKVIYCEKLAQNDVFMTEEERKLSQCYWKFAFML